MLSAGALIWTSFRPLLRLVICTASGFVITKADIFPAVAARGMGQVILNIAFPCLMFSKIVPAFTSQNVHALGPLVLVAVIYEALGMLLAWIVGQIFWVPHQFRFGILVAGGWANIGDIPTSVIMSITGAAPFQGTTDQTLAVAYISAFILVFLVTLFPLGGHHLIAMDYAGLDIEPEEVQQAMRIKRRGWVNFWVRMIRKASLSTTRMRSSDSSLEDTTRDSVNGDDEKYYEEKDPVNLESQRPAAQLHVSFHDDATTTVPTEVGIVSRISSIEPTLIGVETQRNHVIDTELHPNNQSILPTTSVTTVDTALSESLPPPRKNRRIRVLRGSRVLKSFLTPPSISIFISFPIALIPRLKALFVEVPGTYIHPGPDGQPPLAFIMDTCNFIGAASVPLGLICLGSALAQLNVSLNRWKHLPVGAITWLAIGKLLLMPVLGVLICQGLVKVGVIAEEDKLLRFVCIFFSCLPTATTQVFLTQVYSGTGSAEHLSAFLIPQYFLMFISMTALTAYTIQLLF